MTIARGRFQPPQRDTGKRLRVNDLIRISPVRLIDAEDNQVGIIELDKAKAMAREAGLDLVEVSPLSKPPVCRIMDYGKWKYQQRKKEQKARSHAKQSELKELRLRPKTDDHDLDIRVARAREFLADGDKVQFTMLFKGREMAHQDIGLASLREIREKLADISKEEQTPKIMGKRMTMVLAPDRKPKSGEKPAAAAPAAAGAAPAAGAPAGPAGRAPRPAGPRNLGSPGNVRPMGPGPAAPRPAPAAPPGEAEPGTQPAPSAQGQGEPQPVGAPARTEGQ